MNFRTVTTVAIALAGAFPALAQDVDAGKKVFKKCAACHRIGDGAKNAAGPVLNNVIGRTAGTFSGFKYGKGMVEASGMGLIWDNEKISDYITNPKKYLRAFTGNKRAKAKMKFKLKDAQQRADVIAYISSFLGGKMKAESEDDKSEQMTTSTAMDIPANAICVKNAGDSAYFFAVDAGNKGRKTGMLSAGETLCTGSLEMAIKGKVSVYETEEHLEGCTRIVASGTVEEMRKYADFDRCLWSSNDS